MTVQEEDGLLYLAYKRSRYTFIFGLLVSALMVAALWPLVEHAKLSVWLAAMGVIQSLNYLFARHYLRQGHGVAAELAKWKAAFVIASAVSGICWGISILIFPTYQFDLAYILSLFVIAGVSAFACVGKAPVLPAAVAFLLMSLSLLLLSFLSTGDSFHYFAGVIVVAYLVSMLLLSRQIHQMTRVSLGLSELNKGLSAAAQESNQRMTQYFRNAPGFFHTLLRYPDGRYAMPFASKGIRDLFGIDPADVEEDYASFIALTHPDDAERVACLVKESAQQLTPYHVEYRIIHPQQGVRWLEVNSSPQRLPDGGTRWDGYMLDITERKEMDAQLAQREHEFRTLVENAPDIILRYDRQCRLYFANSQLEVALGGSVVPFLGKTPKETVADGRYDLYETAIRRVISGGNDADSTLTILDSYGEESTHHVRMTAERDESGKVVSVFVIARDITERKRQEQVLKERAELEQRQSKYFAMAPGLFSTLVHRADGSYAMPFVSDGVRELFGLAPEEVMRDIGALVARAHPDDVEMTFRKTEESERDLTYFHIEYRIIHPTMGVRWLEVRSMPQRMPDGSTRWDGFWYDITERKKMEEALVAQEHKFRQQAQFQQSLLSGLRDAGVMLVVVENGKFVYTNDHYVGCQLGYAEGALPATVNFIELIHPDDRPRIAEMHRDRLAGKPMPSSYEIGAQGGDGSRREYEFHVTLVPDTDPPQTLLLTLRIDERKKMEQIQLRLTRALNLLSESGKLLMQAKDENKLLEEACRLAVETGGYRMAWVGLAENDEHKSVRPVAQAGYVDGYLDNINVTWADNERGQGPIAIAIRTGEAVVNYDFLNNPGLTPWREAATRRGYRSSVALPLVSGNQILGTLNIYSSETLTLENKKEIALLQELADNLALGIGMLRTRAAQARMEERIAQRERDFRSLAENIPDNVARWDVEGRFLFSNPCHQQTMGKLFAELVGKAHSEIFPDGRFASFDETLAQVVASGKELRIPRVPVPKPDGGTDIHDVRLTPEFDGEGRIVSVLGLGRNMTDIYRMQEALAAREQEFRSLAESSPDSIIRYDLEHRILYLNELLVRELQLASMDEVLGKHPIEVWPDGRFSVIDAAAKRVIAGGNMENVELVWPQEDGTIRYGQITVVPERDVGGQTIGTIAFGRNITAIRETERRLRNLVENLPGIAYTFRLSPDGDMSFPYVSAGVADIYGLSPEDAMGDSAPIHNLAHPDDRPRIEAGIAESARTMTPYRVESRVCRPGHAERWIDVRAAPRREPDGCIFWDGIMLDITERKRVQQQMELLDRAIDMSADAVFLIDEQLRFSYVNETACRALGYSREELLAMGPCDIDDTSMPRAQMQAIMDNSPLGQAISFESRHRARDGRSYPVEISGVHFEVGGKRLGLTVARDISVRKRIEQTLAVREQEFRTLAENSPDVIVRYDRELRRIYINPAWATANGLSVEEALGKRPSDIAAVVSGSAQEFEDQLRKVLESGEPGEIEFGGKDHSGNMKYFSMRVVPEHGEQGAVVGLLTMANDITERKRIENELRHSREMLADAQKLALLGSWDWDVVRNRVEWSEMAYAIYTPDQRPAEPGFEDFKSSLHPDDLERVVAAVQAAFERDEPFDLDHRVVSVSQGVRTVHAQGKVFRDADGKPARMVGTVQDITERKRAEAELQNNFKRISELNVHLEQNARDLEEQAVELEMSKEQLQQTEAWYRSILQSAPDGMLVVDEQGCIMQVNAQLETMFGYGSGELPGCHIEVLLPQAARAAHVDCRDAFISSGQRDRRMAGAAQSLFGCRKDGSEFPVDVSLSRLPDLDCRVGATCAAVRDVSERQKMDVAREQALSEALRLAQLRSAFMAQMSHELRTPLNGILGYAQNLLLQSDVLGEKEVSGLRIIQNSGEHLLTLINGILDHAAIEADKFELIPGDIELELFLGTLIGIIRIRAEQKNISFICDAGAGLPAVVRGDAQRLRQILINLLSNAVKFTDSGEVVLRVNYTAPRMHFAVQDSGIGIAADQLENIFLPFEQVGETSRRAGGTGLGLAISRKLVGLMGGDIKVESRPGAGSTFSFEIEMEVVQSDGGTVNAVALSGQGRTGPVRATSLLFAPPRQALDILHAQALRGNMRDVTQHATRLDELDERYRPFADQLRQLARNFQTKALLGLITQYREEKGGDGEN